MFSRSGRDSATYRPSIARGNSAMPLLRALRPVSVDTSKRVKSLVSSSCGRIVKPSYAV
jgi:hypothetical protein